MKRIFTLALLLAFFAAGCSMTDSDDDFIPKSSEDGSENDCEDGDDECSSNSKGKSSSGKNGSSSSSAKSSSSSSFKPSDDYKIDPSTVIKGTITDSRDGQTYKTVTIGTQTWMAENLNYKTEKSVCIDTTDASCKKYGRSYYWEDLIDPENSGCTQDELCEQPFKGLCPEGFLVPTSSDWKLLLQKVSTGTDKDGNYLEAGYRLSSKERGGSDDYGFSFQKSWLWTSAHYNYGNIYYAGGYRRVSLVKINSINASISDNERTKYDYALRCIKDERPVQDLNDPSTIKSRAQNCTDVKWEPKIKPCNIGGTDNCEYGTYKDKYNDQKTVKIGNQVWMKYKERVGPVYDYEECPDGWTVPDSAQWQELFDNVGGQCFAGKMLKSKSGWDEGNGMNAYGFDLKPTGYQEMIVDNEHRYVSYGREHYGDRTLAPIFVRVGTATTYTKSVYFSTSDAVPFTKQTESSANIFCIKSGPSPNIQDSLLNPEIEYGEFTDPRDGQTYKTTVIGPQKWMAQNLNYKTDSSLCSHDHIYSDYCNSFGRLYRFDDAKTACPTGWHLPSKADFETLMYFGAHRPKAKNLLSKHYGGNDIYGFSIGFGGYAEDRREEYDYIYYGGLRKDADFWSSELKSDTLAYRLFAYNDSLNIVAVSTKPYFISVRCINDTAAPYGYTGEYGTLTDERDGQEYRTVEINGLTWMAENLRYATENPKRSYCFRDSCDYYGRYYVYPLVSDTTEALCPGGWHISTLADWDNLLEFAGDSAGLDLKSLYGWEYYPINRRYLISDQHGTDKYGLGIKPNGCLSKIDDRYVDFKDYSDQKACIGVGGDAKTRDTYVLKQSPAKAVVKENYPASFVGIRCVKDQDEP